MKYLLLIALTSTLFANTSQTYHTNFCKANPYHDSCVSQALGGKDTIKKERKRENHNYYELDDYRTSPSQDMDDMRESL